MAASFSLPHRGKTEQVLAAISRYCKESTRTRDAMQAHQQTRQTSVRLLSSMASAKEISQYLKRFSQLDAKRYRAAASGPGAGP